MEGSKVGVSVDKMIGVALGAGAGAATAAGAEIFPGTPVLPPGVMGDNMGAGVAADGALVGERVGEGVGAEVVSIHVDRIDDAKKSPNVCQLSLDSGRSDEISNAHQSENLQCISYKFYLMVPTPRSLKNASHTLLRSFHPH